MFTWPVIVVKFGDELRWCCTFQTPSDGIRALHVGVYLVLLISPPSLYIQQLFWLLSPVPTNWYHIFKSDFYETVIMKLSVLSFRETDIKAHWVISFRMNGSTQMLPTLLRNIQVLLKPFLQSEIPRFVLTSPILWKNRCFEVNLDFVLFVLSLCSLELNVNWHQIKSILNLTELLCVLKRLTAFVQKSNRWCYL